MNGTVSKYRFPLTVALLFVLMYVSGIVRVDIDRKPRPPRIDKFDVVGRESDHLAGSESGGFFLRFSAKRGGLQ
jgi:hypothetical protein